MAQDYKDVFDAMMLYHSLVERDVYTVRSKLTKQQIVVLAGIELLEPIGSGALANYLSLPPQNVSRNVIDLESQGFVTRTIDPENRRQVIFTLSEEGKAFVDASLKRVNGKLDESLSVLSEDERALLVTSSRVAVNLLQKTLGASPSKE